MEVNRKKIADKRMSLKEAVSTFVKDGSSIVFTGMAGEQVVAPVHEIVRQKAQNLTVVGDSPVEPGDFLCGTGQCTRMEIAWCGYAVAGLAPNFRRSIEKKIPHPVELSEYSNFGMGLRMLAGAIGVPFVPTRSFIGSDLVTYNDNIKVINDPYNNKPIALVPAVHPDVAFVHVTRADKLGNAQTFGFTANAENAARCAKHTIITCERIVSTDEIRQVPNLTIVPQYAVDAVVEVPYGSHPWNFPYEYAYDMPFHMDQLKQYKTREGFLEWIDEWVHGVDDWDGYLKKVGYDRLMKLSQIERKFTRDYY